MATRFRLQKFVDARKPRMSQSELARQSGVSFAIVNGIANNRAAQVSLSTRDALWCVFECAPGDLMERDG
jgi:DNA-binding Xre family transcriptional regulator